MNYSVQIVVFKGEKEENREVVSNSSTNIISQKDLNLLELKQKCKELINTLPPNSVIIEEKVYIGTKEKKDNNEVFKYTHGLEYNLIYK